MAEIDLKNQLLTAYEGHADAMRSALQNAGKDVARFEAALMDDRPLSAEFADEAELAWNELQRLGALSTAFPGATQFGIAPSSNIPAAPYTKDWFLNLTKENSLGVFFMGDKKFYAEISQSQKTLAVWTLNRKGNLAATLVEWATSTDQVILNAIFSVLRTEERTLPNQVRNDDAYNILKDFPGIRASHRKTPQYTTAGVEHFQFGDSNIYMFVPFRGGTDTLSGRWKVQNGVFRAQELTSSRVEFFRAITQQDLATLYGAPASPASNATASAVAPATPTWQVPAVDPNKIKVPTHADEFNALVQAKIPGVFYVGNRAFYALKGVNSAALALMSLNSKGSVVFCMVGDQNPHPQLTERILQAVQTGQAASGIEIKLEEDKLDGNLWIKLKVLGTESNPGTPAQFTTVFQPFSDALTVVNQQFTVQASSDAVTLSDAGSGELLVTFVPFERPAPIEDKTPAAASPQSWKVPTTAAEFDAHVKAGGPDVRELAGAKFIVVNSDDGRIACVFTVIDGKLTLYHLAKEDAEKVFDPRVKKEKVELITKKSKLMEIWRSSTGRLRSATPFPEDMLGMVVVTFEQEQMTREKATASLPSPKKRFPFPLFASTTPGVSLISQTDGSLEVTLSSVTAKFRHSVPVVTLPATSDSSVALRAFPSTGDEFTALVKANAAGVFYIGDRAFYYLQGNKPKGFALMTLNTNGQRTWCSFPDGLDDAHPELQERIMKVLSITGDQKRMVADVVIQSEVLKLGGHIKITMQPLGVMAASGNDVVYDFPFVLYPDNAERVDDGAYESTFTPEMVTVRDKSSGEVMATFEPLAPLEVKSTQPWKVPTTVAEFEAHVKAGGPGVFEIEGQKFIRVPTDNLRASIVFTVFGQELVAHICADAMVQSALSRLVVIPGSRKNWKWIYRPSQLRNALDDYEKRSLIPFKKRIHPQTRANIKAVLGMPAEATPLGLAKQVLYFQPLASYPYLHVSPEGVRFDAHEYTHNISATAGFEHEPPPLGSKVEEDEALVPPTGNGADQLSADINPLLPGLKLSDPNVFSLKVAGKDYRAIYLKSYAIPTSKGDRINLFIWETNNWRSAYRLTLEKVPELEGLIRSGLGTPGKVVTLKGIEPYLTPTHRLPPAFFEGKPFNPPAVTPQTGLTQTMQIVDGRLISIINNRGRFTYAALSLENSEVLFVPPGYEVPVDGLLQPFIPGFTRENPLYFAVEEDGKMIPTILMSPNPDGTYAVLTFPEPFQPVLRVYSSGAAQNKLPRIMQLIFARSQGKPVRLKKVDLPSDFKSFDLTQVIRTGEHLDLKLKDGKIEVGQNTFSIPGYSIIQDELKMENLVQRPDQPTTGPLAPTFTADWFEKVSGKGVFYTGPKNYCYKYVFQKSAQGTYALLFQAVAHGPIYAIYLEPHEIKGDLERLIQAIEALPPDGIVPDFLILSAGRARAVEIVDGDPRPTTAPNPLHVYLGLGLFKGGSPLAGVGTRVDVGATHILHDYDITVDGNGISKKNHRDGSVENFDFSAATAGGALTLPDLTPILPGLNKNHPKVFYITKDDGSLVTCVKLDLHSSSKQQKKTVAFLGIENGNKPYILFTDEKVEELEKIIQTALSGNRVVSKGAWPKFQSHKMVMAPEVEQGKEVKQRDGKVTRLFSIRDGHVFISTHEVMDGFQMRGGGQVNILDIQSFSVEDPAVPFEPTVDGDFGKPVSPAIPGLSDANAYSFMKENEGNVDPSNCVYLPSFLSGQDEFFGVLEFSFDGKVQLHVYDHRDKEVVRFANTLFGILAEPTGKIINKDEWIEPKFSLDLTRALKFNIPAFQRTSMGATSGVVEDGRLVISWDSPHKTSLQFAIPGFPIVPISSSKSTLQPLTVEWFLALPGNEKGDQTISLRREFDVHRMASMKLSLNADRKLSYTLIIDKEGGGMIPGRGLVEDEIRDGSFQIVDGKLQVTAQGVTVDFDLPQVGSQPAADANSDDQTQLTKAIADFNAIERPSEFELSLPPTWERRKWEQVAEAPIPIWMRFLKGSEIKVGNIMEVKVGSADATPVPYDLVATADGFELDFLLHSLKGGDPWHLILRDGKTCFSFRNPQLIFLTEVFGPEINLTWEPDKKSVKLHVKGKSLLGELAPIVEEFRKGHSLAGYLELVQRFTHAYQERIQHPLLKPMHHPTISQIRVENLIASLNLAPPNVTWPIAMKNVKPDQADSFHIEGVPVAVRMQIAVAGRGNLPLNQFLGKSWDATISIWWGNSEKPMTYKAKREGARFVLTPQNGTPKGNVYLNNVEKGESKLSVEENSDLAKLLYDHIHNPQLLVRMLDKAGTSFLEFEGVGDKDSRLWNVFKIYWESRLTEPQKDTEADANGKWTVRLPYDSQDADAILDLLQVTEEACQALKKQPKVLTWKVIEKITTEEISAAAQIKTANGALLDDPLQVKLQLEQKGQGPKEIVGVVVVGATHASPLRGILNQARTGFEVDMPPFGKLIYSLTRTRDGFAVLRVAPEVVWSIDGNILQGKANNWGMVEVGLDPVGVAPTDLEKLKTWTQMLGIPLPKIEKGQALSVWTDVDGKIHLVRVEEWTLEASIYDSVTPRLDRGVQGSSMVDPAVKPRDDKDIKVKIKKIIGPEEKLLRRTIEEMSILGEKIPSSGIEVTPVRATHASPLHADQFPLEIPDSSFPHTFHAQRRVNGDKHVEEFDVVLSTEKLLEIKNATEHLEWQSVSPTILGSEVADVFALWVQIAGNARTGYFVREARIQPTWAKEKARLLALDSDIAFVQSYGVPGIKVDQRIRISIRNLGHFDYSLKLDSSGHLLSATRPISDVAWDAHVVGDEFILTGIAENESQTQVEGQVRKLADGHYHYLLGADKVAQLVAWHHLIGHEFAFDPQNHTHVEAVEIKKGDWRLRPVTITGDILHAAGVELDATSMHELQDLSNPAPIVGAPSSLTAPSLIFATEKYGEKDILKLKPYEILVPTSTTLRMLKDGWKKMGEHSFITTFVGPFYYELEARESGFVLQIPVRFRADRKINPFEIVTGQRPRIYPRGGDPAKAVEITDPNLKMYNDGSRWTIFLLTNRHEFRVKEWELISVVSPDSPALVGAVNRLNDEGQIDEKELAGVKASAIDQIHQVSFTTLGSAPDYFPPLSLGRSKAKLDQDDEITLTFFSTTKVEYWARLKGVRKDKEGKNLLFDRYVSLEVGRGSNMEATGLDVLEKFHYLVPIQMPDGVYRFIEIDDDDQPTGRYFEWIRHRGLFERRLKSLEVGELKELLTRHNIPVTAEAAAGTQPAGSDDAEGDDYATRSRGKDGNGFSVNPLIPELPPLDQGYIFPPHNGIYPLLEGHDLAVAIRALKNQSFLPTEESLTAQVLNGRRVERMMYVSATGALLVLPMEWDEEKRNYFMESKANPLHEVEGAMLLVPNPSGVGFARIPARVHHKRGSRTLHLNLVIGPEEIALHMERVSTTKETLTDQKAFAFVVGDEERDSAPLGHARQHLHEWMEENGLDKASQLMGAKDYQLGQPLTLPDGNGFLPNDTVLMATVKNVNAHFELEGLEEVKEEGRIVGYLLPYVTPEGEGYLTVTRDAGGGAYYLQKANDPLRQYLRVILSKDQGRPYFWLKGTNIKDFLNAPKAVDYEMIGREGNRYGGGKEENRKESVSTRLTLPNAEEGVKVFDVRSVLGRWKGATGSALAVGRGGGTETGTVEDGAMIRQISAQVRFKFRLFPNGQIVVDRAWLKSEGKGERFEPCPAAIVRVPGGRIRLVFKKGADYAFVDFKNQEAMAGADENYSIHIAHYNRKNWSNFNLLPHEPGFLNVLFVGQSDAHLRDAILFDHPLWDEGMKNQLLQMQGIETDLPQLEAMAKKLGYTPEHPDWEKALASIWNLKEIFGQQVENSNPNFWPENEQDIREALEHLSSQKLSARELALIHSLRENSSQASMERLFFWWHYLREANPYFHPDEESPRRMPISTLSVLIGIRNSLGMLEKLQIQEAPVTLMPGSVYFKGTMGPVARFGTMAQIVSQVQPSPVQTVLPSSTAEWSENFQHTVMALNDLKATLSLANWGNFNGRRIQIMEEVQEILSTKNRRRLIQVALAHQENQCAPTVMGYAQAVALTMQNPFYLTLDMMRPSVKPAGTQQFQMGAQTPWTTGSGVRPVAPPSPVLPVR